MSYFGRLGLMWSWKEKAGEIGAEYAVDGMLYGAFSLLGVAASVVLSSADVPAPAPVQGVPAQKRGYFASAVLSVQNLIKDVVTSPITLFTQPTATIAKFLKNLKNWVAPQIVTNSILLPLFKKYFFDHIRPAMVAFLRPFFERFAVMFAETFGKGLTLRDVIPDEAVNPGLLQSIIHWDGYIVGNIITSPIHFMDKLFRTKTAAEYAAPSWYEYGEYCANKIFKASESFANLIVSSKDLFPAIQSELKEMHAQGLKQTVLNGVQHVGDFAAFTANELAVYSEPLKRNAYELSKWTYKNGKEQLWNFGEKVYELSDEWISPKLAIALSGTALASLAYLYLRYKLRRVPGPLVVNNNNQIIQPQPAPILHAAAGALQPAVAAPNQGQAAPDPNQAAVVAVQPVVVPAIQP